MMEEMITEKRNPASEKLDTMNVSEMVELMIQEDATVSKAIQEQLPKITSLIEAVVERLNRGGRLFYIGAGTSGRLGILDAVECVPTFGTSPELVQGIIAGGHKAIKIAVEGAEDSLDLAVEDLKERKLTEDDIVIGIAASGRTPYVIGGLKYATKIGAQTGSISNNPNAPLSKLVKFPIEVVTGPEVLTGSTRLKAGTAQKQVLNMISTVAMVKLGKVYGNLMVDVQATNEKLIERSKLIIMEATGVEYEKAADYYESSENSVKLAIIRILSCTTLEEAKKILVQKNGRVREAVNSINIKIV
ncbi:N-acetylmuramic acid 6-phosphate etherase [Desemzia incerta]|uniref:N-acetylmuramic acid 6-phosphate etherase n=1 Tax=Desemzia incerta TaxID=82801 RepID=UPI0024C37E05|nr:N-acetylmuramic acid 6-phosphate etherase [Desemzia incerta]WHZ32887.1 N-acetylmuramic acid 6-phosphate etherase [Desemzia incerta]